MVMRDRTIYGDYKVTNLKKNKLKDAMDAVREVFYDAIECRIKFSGRSYAAIASELGCSEQLVFQVAKLRGLGRNSQPTTSTEVADE
jgi:hypothetical protein